ncbi:MAG: site-specific integrase [Gallionellaceae bacterium]
MNPDYHSSVWLHESQLASYVGAFTVYLTERRYASNTIDSYLSCIAHFARWSTQTQIDIHRIDEKVVWQFLDHLPHCDCARQVHRVSQDLRAALGHLLIVLRANAVIAYPPAGITPVDDELRHFDSHMNHVRGLAPKTRSLYLRTVQRLLFAQFADQPVVISAIKPDDVRKFVVSQGELCSIPVSIGTTVSALRGYFRFRVACGDKVHHLIGVVCHPANWQLASLPKALSGAEVERLLGALGHDGPSARRTAAIVHCALDLGLRSSEVANLGLDDIDWIAATVTLRRAKSRREDVMPLPAATGRAIANYLKFERPQTANRAVFVRNIAPRDKPIGVDLVRHAIRQAYARAGLPYTRAHLLRHTMASRLLEGGSSLKEVADVLRHRSLNTTLIYAKLDSRSLAAVALPWPGSAS